MATAPAARAVSEPVITERMTRRFDGPSRELAAQHPAIVVALDESAVCALLLPQPAAAVGRTAEAGQAGRPQPAAAAGRGGARHRCVPATPAIHTMTQSRSWGLSPAVHACVMARSGLSHGAF